MKFTKEQAIEKIKANYEAKGEKSNLDRTIKEHVEHLLSVLGEESEIELDDFVAKVTPFVDTAAGLYRKVAADAVNSYKKEHPEPPKPPKEPSKQDPLEDEKSELEKRLEALEAELNESKKARKVEEVKTSLLAKMKEKGIKDDEWAKDFVSELTITEDLDIEAKAESYLKLYNKSKSPITHITPKAAGGEEEPTKNALSDVEEFVKNANLERAEFEK